MNQPAQSSPKVEIFKVQLPLITNAPQPFALVYNEDRSLEYHLPLSDEIIEIFNREPKSFWFGYVSDKDEFVIEGPAPWQYW